MSDYGEHPDLPPSRQERTDAATGWLALGLAGVGATVLLVSTLVWWMFPNSLAGPAGGPLRAYPAPRLQSNPAADMARFHADQLRALNGAWWIDRAHGTAHQPIDSAMRDLARDGIPDWPNTSPNPSPARAEIRDGTPPAKSVLRGQPRNVVNDSLAPETAAP